MSTTEMIICGCLGGLLPDVLRVIKNRYDKSLPDYFKSGIFWLGVVLLAALGGFVAWLLSAQSVKEAIAYGFAAPELVSRLVAETIEKPKDRGREFNLLQWWAS